MFQISEVQESAAFNGRRSFLTLRGFVFNPAPRRPGYIGRLGEQQVGRTIGKIGQRANVVVRTEPVEYASAHDLRRSFCQRWSMRVLPQVLMQLARHKTIHTTMTFYAGRDAELAADATWDAFANTSANIGPKSPESTNEEKAATHF
jgi:integrase